MNALVILLVIVGAIGLLLIVIYNRLVALRQKRLNAFSDIDVQLKQRYDLIPNLVETVKAYAKHEDKVFMQVTEARASAMKSRDDGIEGRAAAEGVLGAAMMQLMAVAENYPALKANENFQQLQTELSDLENKIAAARRFFNNATSELNTAIQQFPAVLFAASFGFKNEAFFELPEAEAEAVQKAPDVNF
jgi:LemA protein